MRYRITHRTAYTYDSPAYESFNEVRLRPLSDETQTCLDFRLAIDPPSTVIAFQDYYGNAVHDFGVPFLHEHLAIEATSDVVTFVGHDEPLAGPRDGEPDRSPPLASLTGDPAFADEHAEFLTPSAYVALDGEATELATTLLAADPDASAYTFFRAAAAHVHAHLAYQIGTTTVHSTVADVLAGGSGVCQDFAHLLIAICRAAGLPTRYVSGYLGDITESTASHAWAEAYVPPYGWLGIDPTADMACTGRHIKLAVGRDYADVSVVRGTYRGGAASGLEVTVRSEVVEGARGLVMASGRGRRELVQYQTLGAMKQLQRLGTMTQSLETMTQTLGSMSQSLTDPIPGMREPAEEGDKPRQQPQQQQQQESILGMSRLETPPGPKEAGRSRQPHR